MADPNPAKKTTPQKNDEGGRTVTSISAVKSFVSSISETNGRSLGQSSHNDMDAVQDVIEAKLHAKFRI